MLLPGCAGTGASCWLLAVLAVLAVLVVLVVLVVLAVLAALVVVVSPDFLFFAPRKLNDSFRSAMCASVYLFVLVSPSLSGCNQVSIFVIVCLCVHLHGLAPLLDVSAWEVPSCLCVLLYVFRHIYACVFIQNDRSF